MNSNDLDRHITGNYGEDQLDDGTREKLSRHERDRIIKKNKLPKDTYTCNTCPDADYCPYSWDVYNVDGDCLVEK